MSILVVLCIVLISVGITSSASPILPRESGRFILWTSDGENVMWGTYTISYSCNPESDSNCPQDVILGTFSAKDSMGRVSRGSFTKHIDEENTWYSFEGYYIRYNNWIRDSMTFKGRFENGYWKAEGLFNRIESSGEYKFFSMPIVIRSPNNMYTLK